MDFIDANRSTPGRYVLNGKDRMYCVTGQGQGSLKKSELRSRITHDRLQELPQRFQDLFDDLALVEYSDTDFLSDSEKDEIWREVLKVDTHANTIRGYDIDHISTHPDDLNNKYRFGVGLGTLLRGMNGVDISESANFDLVWGFILGLYALPTETREIEVDRIGKLLSDLNDKIETRSEHLETKSLHREDRKKSINRIRDQILEILSEEGIDTDYVPLNIQPSMRAYLPDNKEELREKILNEVNINALEKTKKLKNAVKSDGQNILDDEFRGDEAKPIINELWLVSQSGNNDAVRAKNINTMSSRSTGMKLVNQYKSTEMHDDSVHFPVIEEVNTGYRLTSYGKLVSYCLFENDGDCNWIEQFQLFYTGKPFPGRADNLSDKREAMVGNALNEIDIDAI